MWQEGEGKTDAKSTRNRLHQTLEGERVMEIGVRAYLMVEYTFVAHTRITLFADCDINYKPI